MKKISELSTSDGIRVLGRLATEFNKIASDVTFKNKCAEFAEIVNKGNATPFEQLGMFASFIVNDYPDTIVNILATLQNKTAKDIQDQPFVVTLSQVKLLSEDRDLINFFTSFTNRALPQ